MRICMLVANPITFDGRVIRHARTLAEAGHEVIVLGVVGPNDRLGDGKNDGGDGDLAGQRFAVWRLDRRRTGVLPRLLWLQTAVRQRVSLRLAGLLPEPVLTVLPGLAELAVATSAVELMAKAVTLRCDVYHGNDLNTLPAVAWAGRALSRPYIYDAHEFYVEETPELTRAERRTREVTEGRLIQGAAAVLTVNELIADSLAGRYGVPRPVVVRNLPPLYEVADPAMLPAGQEGSLRLLYHGANVGLNQIGTDDMLRAMARVKDRLDIHLTIRGRMSAEDDGKLRQRVAELGLSERVRPCPPVSGAVALIAAAVADGEEVGLSVHPPLCGNYNYATSSKIYEYQGAGLGVVATDVIGTHLTVDERAGVFYPYGDDEKLAEIFMQLAYDRQRLRAMRHAGWLRAREELCWERERERLLAVYERLAQDTRSS